MRKLSVFGIGVLCFALAGCLEVFDQEAAEAEALEVKTRLDELQNQKRNLYSELSEKKKTVRDFDRIRSREAKLRLEFSPVGDYVSSLEIADEYLKTQLEIWRKATRESLKELPLGTFRTVSGATITKGVVAEVRDEEVVIRFDGGEQAFPWDDLPEQLRLALVHEPSVTLNSKISNF